MKHTRILFLIALVAGLGLMPGWELTSAAQTCQQEGACFAFESQGYISNPSNGQTTIAFRVTNKCRNPASYVAFGTGGFTRVAPADGSSYNGDLGLYDVAWTRAGGTPGFESVKFTPTLKNFANSASEMFNVVVSNFNPATMIMVRSKAGNAQETYNFLLSQTCGIPTPTRRIYWGNAGTYTIGRANLNGQNVNQSFINGTRSTTPFGMAVDSRHIYWASNQNHTIGRADLDGQNVNQSFIANVPCAYWVAVDSRYIYWTDAATNTIGRADLDGQNVNQNFIVTAPVGALGLAVDGSHIYWANVNPETIGRADLDGQNVDQNFIVLTGQSVGLYGLAVDSSHIYWADVNNRIGRAELDGQNVNLTFISGCQQPRGVAVDRSHIYWTNDGNSIGQADLDGQNVNQSFIPNCPGPFGIAIDPE
jgi:sugar lactone lactonase YvrE